ncbi:MAG: hypothetical protein ACYTHM_16285 [Planctomycetota bacterium]|jgi:hypothetical protein
MEFSEEIRAEVESRFSREASARVLKIFAESEFPLVADNGDRILRAILHLAEGDVGELEKQVALAKIDWRDVLVSAGMG